MEQAISFLISCLSLCLLNQSLHDYSPLDVSVKCIFMLFMGEKKVE